MLAKRVSVVYKEDVAAIPLPDLLVVSLLVLEAILHAVPQHFL